MRWILRCGRTLALIGCVRPGDAVRLRLVSLALVAATACGGQGPTSSSFQPGQVQPVELTPVPQTADWPASTPTAEGLDAARLTDVLNRIRRREYGVVDSLLVVRNERLVMEEYFNGFSAAGAHTMQSVSKSVTSLAAGLAVDRGLLRVEDTVVPFFPDYAPVAALDGRKQALSARDLLTMRTGLQWTEGVYEGSPLFGLNNCSCDWVRFVLDWPMGEPPGTRFEYNSGGVILLGAVIGRATGRPVDVLLEQELFAPLGFQNVQWFRGQPQGLPHTGGGLSLRPRDMAKLGTLVVTGGAWQGRQVLSEAWIRESTDTSGIQTYGLAGLPATYGYLWWGLPGGVVAASGNGGQWILVVPHRRLVLASTASNTNEHFGAAVRILYDHVLPAAAP
jgi:CubicO group peptidase (beta-lactamase class C family)